MAKLNVSLPCWQGGRSIITLNFCAIRGGGDNDKATLRLLRQRSGFPDVQIVGTPDFTLLSWKQMYSWTWVDSNIPADGTWLYQLQIMRTQSGATGTFFETLLLGLHFKR